MCRNFVLIIKGILEEEFLPQISFENAHLVAIGTLNQACEHHEDWIYNVVFCTCTELR